MLSKIITEQEYDKLADQVQGNYRYCDVCKMYVLCHDRHICTKGVKK